MKPEGTLNAKRAPQKGSQFLHDNPAERTDLLGVRELGYQHKKPEPWKTGTNAQPHRYGSTELIRDGNAQTA